MTTQDSTNSNGSIGNQLIVTGNVAFTPEFAYLQSGTAICKTKLYVTRRWVDKKSGEKMEKTIIVKIQAWGEKAESMKDAIGQGDLVEITGELQQPEAWLDKTEKNTDGTAKIMTINVMNVREGRVIFTKRQDAGQTPAEDTKTQVSRQETDMTAPPLPSDFAEYGDIPF